MIFGVLILVFVGLMLISDGFRQFMVNIAMGIAESSTIVANGSAAFMAAKIVVHQIFIWILWIIVGGVTLAYVVSKLRGGGGGGH
jgi:hypothetical protein